MPLWSPESRSMVKRFNDACKDRRCPRTDCVQQGSLPVGMNGPPVYQPTLRLMGLQIRQRLHFHLVIMDPWHIICEQTRQMPNGLLPKYLFNRITSDKAAATEPHDHSSANHTEPHQLD